MKNSKLFFVLALTFISMLRLVAGASNYNIEIVKVSPTNLIPGEQNELSFEIENTGDEDLENVIFSWEEKTGSILPIGLSNTKTIQELDEGDEETLDFDVFTSASAEPGLYELTLTLTYKNENETTIKTSKVGIIVGGQTDFDISVSDVSSSGIIFSVANIGKNPANSVTLVIPSQPNFRISGSSSSIIGNLDKGDYSVASFQITSQSGSSSNLNVEIQYTDTMGTRQTITKTVSVQSTQSSFSTTDVSEDLTGFASRNTSSSGNNNWFLIAFIISSILTIILVVVLIKKNKKKNERS